MTNFPDRDAVRRPPLDPWFSRFERAKGAYKGAVGVATLAASGWGTFELTTGGSLTMSALWVSLALGATLGAVLGWAWADGS